MYSIIQTRHARSRDPRLLALLQGQEPSHSTSSNAMSLVEKAVCSLPLSGWKTCGQLHRLKLQCRSLPHLSKECEQISEGPGVVHKTLETVSQVWSERARDECSLFPAKLGLE